MCNPFKSTLAPTTLVLIEPAFINPLAVPVRLPPPAFVQTTISGSFYTFL